MTLGKRLEKANEIARKRAERSGWREQFTQEQLEHLTRHPPSKDDRPHKDAESIAQFEPAKFRKWNGARDCPNCKAAKAERSYKGKGSKKRAWRERLDEDDFAV